MAHVPVMVGSAHSELGGAAPAIPFSLQLSIGFSYKNGLYINSCHFLRMDL